MNSMIIDKENIHDDNIIAELLDIVVLNEFLKKDLLIAMSNYITGYNGSFDYSRPVSCIDFNSFLKKDENIKLGLNFNQLLFNLELFVLKFYRVAEICKKSLKGTKFKKIRQSFSHRKSPDILNGKERLVVFGGMSLDPSPFTNFYIKIDA